jgi:hypothetical protein
MSTMNTSFCHCSLSLSVSVRFPVILEFVLLLECCLIVLGLFYQISSFQICPEFDHHQKLTAMQHFAFPFENHWSGDISFLICVQKAAWNARDMVSIQEIRHSSTVFQFLKMHVCSSYHHQSLSDFVYYL